MKAPPTPTAPPSGLSSRGSASGLARGWGSGTHTGAFLGIAPTGKPVHFRAAHVFQVRDGQIAARWAYPDMLSMLQQLGVVPTPVAPPAGR